MRLVDLRTAYICSPPRDGAGLFWIHTRTCRTRDAAGRLMRFLQGILFLAKWFTGFSSIYLSPRVYTTEKKSLATLQYYVTNTAYSLITYYRVCGFCSRAALSQVSILIMEHYSHVYVRGAVNIDRGQTLFYSFRELIRSPKRAVMYSSQERYTRAYPLAPDRFNRHIEQYKEIHLFLAVWQI